MSEQRSNKERVEKPKCQWLGCTKPATVRIVRANTLVCDKHHKLNEERFGCKLSVERL